jgi:hypothetical protein
VVLERPQRAADSNEKLRPCAVDADLADEDRDLQAWRGKAECDGDEALTRARLHPLDHHRQAAVEGVFEERDLAALRLVKDGLALWLEELFAHDLGVAEHVRGEIHRGQGQL